MPGCAVHLELARRVLEAWGNRSGDAPFPLGDPVCRRAFFFGSLAPDLGYFPGGEGLLADLAHCVRPAHLARNLINSAENELERALAWGWVTHVLGDIWIHPLINQAAGERAFGHRLPGLTYADDPVAHVRIELGMDAILPAKFGWPHPCVSSGFDPGWAGVEALTRAYRQTYGLSFSGLRMRLSHHLVGGFVSALLAGGRVYSDQPVRPLIRLAHRGAARLARRCQPGGLLSAFTNPLPPPNWLLDECGLISNTFAERFEPYYRSRLSSLPDYNLDTGSVEGDPPYYRLTVSALTRLERRIDRAKRDTTSE
jgi:hypothetical protein